MNSINVILKRNFTVFVWIFLGVLFFLLKLYSDYVGNTYNSQISLSPKITSGQIYKLKATKSGLVGSFRFFVNDNVYYSETTDGRYTKIGSEIFKKCFPVIYNGHDPSINRILVFPDDFKDFNLSFPDSLNWVMERAK